jgi:hypothetical protein
MHIVEECVCDLNTVLLKRLLAGEGDTHQEEMAYHIVHVRLGCSQARLSMSERESEHQQVSNGSTSKTFR